MTERLLREATERTDALPLIPLTKPTAATPALDRAIDWGKLLTADTATAEAARDRLLTHYGNRGQSWNDVTAYLERMQKNDEGSDESPAGAWEALREWEYPEGSAGCD